ncbi:MAG: hypothetical protein LBC84_09295, partial [Prevotellaceae bacterium]|nr:hypothetical protein [Prevotellaceae bacterium]
MRFSLTIGIAGILLWSACSKDLSCYRDMIIGTWVEQAFDGQTLEANDRSVHIFDALNQHTIKRTATDKDNLRSIETVLH